MPIIVIIELRLTRVWNYRSRREYAARVCHADSNCHRRVPWPRVSRVFTVNLSIFARTWIGRLRFDSSKSWPQMYYVHFKRNTGAISERYIYTNEGRKNFPREVNYLSNPPTRREEFAEPLTGSWSRKLQGRSHGVWNPLTVEGGSGRVGLGWVDSSRLESSRVESSRVESSRFISRMELE